MHACVDTKCTSGADKDQDVRTMKSRAKTTQKSRRLWSCHIGSRTFISEHIFPPSNNSPRHRSLAWRPVLQYSSHNGNTAAYSNGKMYTMSI